MFGFSLPELVVVLLVGIVVVGPRRLPELLRTAGKWVGKLQRLAYDMRSQSGIDKILQEEGLADDIRQLRSLLRRRNVLDALSMDDLDLSDLAAMRPKRGPSRVKLDQGDDLANAVGDGITDTERAYPEDGCDSYGASGARPDPYEQSEHGDDEEEANGQEVLEEQDPVIEIDDGTPTEQGTDTAGTSHEPAPSEVTASGEHAGATS